MIKYLWVFWNRDKIAVLEKSPDLSCVTALTGRPKGQDPAQRHESELAELLAPFPWEVVITYLFSWENVDILSNLFPVLIWKSFKLTLSSYVSSEKSGQDFVRGQLEDMEERGWQFLFRIMSFLWGRRVVADLIWLDAMCLNWLGISDAWYMWKVIQKSEILGWKFSWGIQGSEFEPQK